MKMHLKKQIERIKHSKDGRVLLENFLSLSLLQVAGYIFPLITLPYLARVIGVDKFGEIAFALSITVYFQTITDWGFNYTATREVARNKDNIQELSKIFSSVICAKFFLMLVSFLILIILIVCVPKFKEISLLLFITFSIIPGQILFPEWLFQGLERMKYITILNLFSKLLFTIAIFLFIKEKSDFFLQPIFVSLGFVCSGITAMIVIAKWKIRFYIPSLCTIKKTIKGSTDVFINNLMPNLYNSFSVLLLGFTGGQVANGKLDAGNKFVIAGQQLQTIISRTFFPFLSRRIDRHNQFAKYSIGLSIIISVILFIFSPLIIHIFFTKEFYDAIFVMRILSVSIIFLTLCNVYGTNFLIIEGYEHALRNITIIVSIIGFCIAIPLVYNFSYIGAALTICITRGLLGLGSMVKAIKVKNTK